MILVDTSVLIDYLKDVKTRKSVLFQEVLDCRFSYGICDVVYLEVLQGARDEAEYQQLQDYLESQRFYDVRCGRASFERAARMYHECRRSGTTLRSTIDLVTRKSPLRTNATSCTTIRTSIRSRKSPS